MIATVALLAGPAMAAALKPAAKVVPDSVDDLTVAATRHAAICPLPKVGACVIRKPVDTGYRVLTPGIDLDDKGDHWIAEFAKSKDARILLRILGRNGDLHEIEVSFRNGPAPKASNSRK